MAAAFSAFIAAAVGTNVAAVAQRSLKPNELASGLGVAADVGLSGAESQLLAEIQNFSATA